MIPIPLQGHLPPALPQGFGREGEMSQNPSQKSGMQENLGTNHTRSAPVLPFYSKNPSFPPLSLGSFTQKLGVNPETPIWNRCSKQLKETLNPAGIYAGRCYK